MSYRIDDLSLISIELANALSKKGVFSSDPHYPSVLTALGELIDIKGILEMEIDFVGHQQKFSFHVVQQLPVCVPLGVDFLKNYDVQLDFLSETIKVGRLSFLGEIQWDVNNRIADQEPTMKSQLRSSLTKVANVFRDKPDLTNIVEHKIEVENT